LQLRRRSELRFIFKRPIAGSEITAVGRADLRHVIIAFAPCIIAAAARDASCFHVCVLWFCFGAVDEKHRRRYANATLPTPETQSCRGQTPPFLIDDETRARELWFETPRAMPVCRDDT
jgi:hypothetical protein